MRTVTNKAYWTERLRKPWDRDGLLGSLLQLPPPLPTENSLQGLLGIKKIPLHSHVPASLRHVLVCVGSVLLNGLERVEEACY